MIACRLQPHADKRSARLSRPQAAIIPTAPCLVVEFPICQRNRSAAVGAASMVDLQLYGSLTAHGSMTDYMTRLRITPTVVCHWPFAVRIR
jgi:hypothetical protein